MVCIYVWYMCVVYGVFVCIYGTPAVTGRDGFFILLYARGQKVATETEAGRVNGYLLCITRGSLYL